MSKGRLLTICRISPTAFIRRSFPPSSSSTLPASRPSLHSELCLVKPPRTGRRNKTIKGKQSRKRSLSRLRHFSFCPKKFIVEGKTETACLRIATIEGLVAGLISGVSFSLFSGQPLNLLGSTGPVYVFEKILFEMCEDQNWDYLSLRLWIGIWVGVMLLLLVMFDASAYVCYITRFTEELFATLVAFIFIMSAFKNTFSISKGSYSF